jgi:hypothetical protein
MLILGHRRFIQAPFSNESELETVVVENAEYIFGPSSIYFPKRLIRTVDGTGTIPDGFVIDPSSRQWFVVEAELLKHGVWTHIAPQVAKQIIAASQPLTRQLLTELSVEKVREDEGVKEKFTEQGIDLIDIRRVLAEILETKPIIGMPIDSVSRDLQEWATTLKNEVKLWIVRKYVEFGCPENVLYEIPEEYRPVLDTREDTETRIRIARYDVTLADLIEAGLLRTGEVLYMSYGPRNSEKQTYEGVVHEDGSIEVLGRVFSAPSYAALYGIQHAGSERRTVNGWAYWKNADGAFLTDLRDLYLEGKAREAEAQQEQV